MDNTKKILLGVHIPKEFDKEIKTFLDTVNKEPDRITKLYQRDLVILAVKDYMKNYKKKEE